jgi:hypothetical protein
MNVTKDIINDLIPLYVANECSADTRALVEEYLQRNPQQAEELRRIMVTSVPQAVPSSKSLDEMRSWLMAIAIFFSLAPLSFFSTGERTWWFLRDAPASAAVYVALGVVCWIIYAVERSHSRSL